MENITLLIVDHHQEYEIPIPDYLKFKGVHSTQVYDGMRLGDLLEDAGYKDSEEMLEKIVKGLYENGQYLHHYKEGDISAQTYSHFQALYLPNEDCITSLHWHWSQEILKAGAVTGGDDDFYDYFPNFVDMYLSFCQLTNRDHRETIKTLNKIIIATHGEDTDWAFRNED
jgi:hypothetical protein